MIKIRKIKHRGPKSFGIDSRRVDGVYIKSSDAGGRSVGSKQVHPKAYKVGYTKIARTRKEILNSIERKELDA